MSALDDRRQAAVEAYYDKGGLGTMPIDEAIETATRVRIDDELVQTFRDRGVAGFGYDQRPGDIAGALADVFRAAGFEVEE